ncbi:MAG: SdiA-regulated domain-containing protein [Acidobacteria bacterium]|nr:SdiA-regulated domain-containing protein [Acidobacteriota bacterium]
MRGPRAAAILSAASCGTAAILSAASCGAAAVCLLVASLDAPAQRTGNLLDSLDFGTPETRVELPDALNEISGLASVLTEGGGARLFAHDDEKSVIHELDAKTFRILKSFSLQSRYGRGDFEGLTVIGPGPRFALLSSDGRVLLFDDTPANGVANATLVDTRAGKNAELEGILFEPSTGELLLARKQATRKGDDDVLLFRFRLPEGPAGEALRLGANGVRKATQGGKDFRMSDACRDPVSGHYILLSSHAGALLEIDRTGPIAATRRLPKDRHRQPEGIAILPGGRLAIADEAAGGRDTGGRATITVYRPR